MLTLGVILYIIYYILYYYILYIYYILYYYILYYYILYIYVYYILYYYIYYTLYIYYYIIYYTLLFLLFFSSFPLPPNVLFSSLFLFSSPILLSLPFLYLLLPSILSFKVYVSAFGYPYLYILQIYLQFLSPLPLIPSSPPKTIRPRTN